MNSMINIGHDKESLIKLKDCIVEIMSMNKDQLTIQTALNVLKEGAEIKVNVENNSLVCNESK